MPHIERMRPLMGTFVTIRADSVPSLTAEQMETAVQSAFRAVECVDRHMSFHRKRNDIGRLNRGRPGMILRVHRWTYTVLGEAIRLWQVSGGVFDCDVGAHLIRAGLLPGSILGRSRRHLNLGAAITLRPDHKVLLHRSVSLDLGGIAKGFAVDKAVETLKAHGVKSGLVNAGGDLRVFGMNPQPIWVRRPDSNEQRQLIGTLNSGAVATSAAYFTRDASTDNIEASAVFDTTRNRRVVTKRSISVIARTCMQADALTKIAMILGRLPTSLARPAQAQVIQL